MSGGGLGVIAGGSGIGLVSRALHNRSSSSEGSNGVAVESRVARPQPAEGLASAMNEQCLLADQSIGLRGCY
ncbi:hypothetical protein KL918_004714 [Ogataea parapolymorpha]|nr:hypothetical protein KL918_004714 [Ogataea parapolymorpha]KAG7872717.1 hypothetical protein KL916_002762 [Ogataea parapolymorpha]